MSLVRSIYTSLDSSNSQRLCSVLSNIFENTPSVLKPILITVGIENDGRIIMSVAFADSVVINKYTGLVYGFLVAV